MDDRTKNVLNGLKDYIDNAEVTYEALEDVSRVAVMAVGGMVQLTAFLSEKPGGANKIAEASQKVYDGLLELMRTVKPDAEANAG
jgi:hypothetical protein